MVRMMILPLSVVLLAASGYLNAAQSVRLNPNQDACSIGLGDYMSGICLSRNGTLLRLSGCTFICEGYNALNQKTYITINLVDGLPCGSCQQCCGGNCKPVTFNLKNFLSVKSCAE
uniref:Putative secreted protein n=1 Tax=Ixodes ricinus TaxID=34613 RepID=V5GYG5_IXORI